MTTNTKFVIATTDSCTIATKGGNIPKLAVGTKLRVQVGSNQAFDAESGFSTPHQLCLAKGSAGAKRLAMELKVDFVKGQSQEVTIEVVE